MDPYVKKLAELLADDILKRGPTFALRRHREAIETARLEGFKWIEIERCWKQIVSNKYQHKLPNAVHMRNAMYRIRKKERAAKPGATKTIPATQDHARTSKTDVVGKAATRPIEALTVLNDPAFDDIRRRRENDKIIAEADFTQFFPGPSVARSKGDAT